MWKIFNFVFHSGDSPEQREQDMVKWLDFVEEQGWEPRKIHLWGRNSIADRDGVSIYARKKD
jgi:hypothetical protein